VINRRNSEEAKRRRIFRRDDYRCVYCGRILPVEDLTLDHVEPRVKGGDRSDGNLVTACRTCNTVKAGEAAWSFLARDPERRANFLRFADAVWPRLRRAVEQAAQSRLATGR